MYNPWDEINKKIAEIVEILKENRDIEGYDVSEKFDEVCIKEGVF